jgi:hypothetical protein
MVLRGLALGTTYKDVWSTWAVSAAAALNLAWPKCTDATDRGRGALVSRKGASCGPPTQQDRDPVELLIGLLRASAPGVADLRIPGHR